MPENRQEEFVVLLTSHQSRLRGLIRVLMPWSRDVEDVLQETNLVLWRKADNFEVGTNFWAWASTVARFEVNNHLRRSGREPYVFSDELAARLATTTEARLSELDDRRVALEQCLASLPTRQRELVDRRYRLAQSCGAIADTVGRSTGSVRTTLMRIRRTLQECVRRRMVVEERA